jgi:hypothetical protein
MHNLGKTITSLCRVPMSGSDFLRETDEGIELWIPSQRQPTLAELKGFYGNPWIDRIRFDVSPTGPVKFRIGTVLGEKEVLINGPEYRRRLMSSGIGRTIGFQQLNWLVENQGSYPVFMEFLGQFAIDGPALAVIGEDGTENSPYICRNSGSGRWDWKWAPLFQPVSKFNQRCRIGFGI